MEMWDRRTCWDIKYKGVSGCEGEGAKAQGCLGAVWESFLRSLAEKRSGPICNVRILYISSPSTRKCNSLGGEIVSHLDGSCLAQHIEQKRWSGASQLGGHLDLACRAREGPPSSSNPVFSWIISDWLSHDKDWTSHATPWHWARLCHKTFPIQTLFLKALIFS